MSESTPPLASSTAELYPAIPIALPKAPPQRYWLHALLLLLTCFTTLVMGARMQYNFTHNQPALSFEDDSVPYFPVKWAVTNPKWFWAGAPFALAVMLFFLAHEMGHYLCCVRYGIYATLPFFIPVPTLIGTMGAVILIRSRIRSRTALFDVAVAGPIAGFLVATLLLLLSLGLSKPMPYGAGTPDYELAYPLIFKVAYGALGWMGLAHGAAGLPLHRLLLHPVAIAAWVGMFATALNLLPGGQLDGGHIVFALVPRTHRFVSRITILSLLGMTYYLWTGWFLWAILLQLTSLRHPQVAEWPRVSGARTWLALFALLMLVLTLAPAPFAHASGREALPYLWSWLHDQLILLRHFLGGLVR
jgi:membrane-associated protease RseP (regulator of RpoE activity)